MRIGEVARLAGTTPRALRHYHVVGVLPEPARNANGYRRYELVDLVRVTRIRWLLAGGLSLREVGAALQDETGRGMDLDDELEAALGRVMAEQARLARQERVLRGLLADTRGGQEASAVDAAVRSGLDAVAEATGMAAGGLLDTERNAVDLMVHSGLADADAQGALAASYRRVAADPVLVAALADVEGRLVAMAGTDPRTITVEVDAVADLLRSILDRAGIDDFVATLGTEPGSTDASDDNLWSETLFPDPAHRAVMAALLARRTS